jgi:signal transduction histidine kinase
VVDGQRLSWRAVLLVCVAYSVLAALVSFWFTRTTGLSLWTLQADASADFAYILAMNLVLWGGWGLFAPIVLLLASRFRFDREGWRSALLVHVPSAVALTSLHIVVVASGRYGLQRMWGLDVEWQPLVRENFFRTLDFELPVYCALVGLQHALDYYREVRRREVAAAQVETRLVEAQLLALQRQLHPHFLFNTLHAISALVHRDPTKAEAMIERLGDLLRLTLDKVGVQQVPLAEEIDYLRAYLDIEQVHFGSRLEIVYRIDAHALDALVPSLMLQPLAENAIRHGLEPRASRGRLTIEAARREDRVVLTIADNGVGLRPWVSAGTESGVGLSNTRGRLERLHGSAASLELTPTSGGGVTVVVSIPFRKAATDEDSSGRRRRSADGARAVARAAR